MKKLNNKGMAYLLILILGGLLITGTGVYYASSVTEARVSTNSRLSKEVFYHAENALNTFYGNLLKSPSQLGGDDILTSNDIENIRNLNKGVVYPVTKQFTRSTNQGQLKAEIYIKCSNSNGGEGEFDPLTKYLTIYSNGWVERNSKKLLARNIEQKIELIFKRTTGGGPPGPYEGLEYALATGSTLNFSGNTKVIANPETGPQVGKGVYAVGNLNLGNAKNQLRIDRGEAYTSSTTVSGVGIINPRSGFTKTNPNQPIMEFPKVNFDYYKDMADYKYIGNQQFPSVQSWSDIYPPADPTATPPKTEAGDGQVIVFINGDLKITGQFINTTKLILVVTGNVFLTGNAQLGSPTVPFAILAGGDISRGTGSAKMYGVYYTTENIDLRGTFEFRGGMYAKKSVTMTGTVDIYYDKNLTKDAEFSLGYTQPDPNSPWYVDNIIRVSGSWKENPLPFKP